MFTCLSIYIAGSEPTVAKSLALQLQELFLFSLLPMLAFSFSFVVELFPFSLLPMLAFSFSFVVFFFLRWLNITLNIKPKRKKKHAACSTWSNWALPHNMSVIRVATFVCHVSRPCYVEQCMTSTFFGCMCYMAVMD